MLLCPIDGRLIGLLIGLLVGRMAHYYDGSIVQQPGVGRHPSMGFYKPSGWRRGSTVRVPWNRVQPTRKITVPPAMPTSGPA